MALVPSTALAVEVECSNEDGTCTVSNDGGSDSVDCTCDGVASGTTGGNEWAGLDEDEMEEVCLGELEFCGGFGTTFGTDTGVFTDSATSGMTSVGPVTTDPTVASESATTDGPMTSTSSDSESESDSDTTTGGFELTSSSSGDPDTTGGPVDPTDTTGGPASDSQSATNPNAETGEGDDDTAPEQTTTDSGGCGCTTRGGGGGWALALGFVGLLGLRRRR